MHHRGVCAIKEEYPTFVQVLAVFILANFVPQAIIYVVAGKPYFAFDQVNGLITEILLMMLNLLLPLWFLTHYNRLNLKEIRNAVAWHMYGWKTVSWGLVGFIIGFPANFFIFARLIPYSSGASGGEEVPLNLFLFLLLIADAIAGTLGEEVMFRGYIQTGIGKRYGPKEGLLAGAFLYALRHYPLYVYSGLAEPLLLVRSLLVLHFGALVFGCIRHRSNSTIATWIMHILGWFLIVFGQAWIAQL